jgi:hypothetical protein
MHVLHRTAFAMSATIPRHTDLEDVRAHALRVAEAGGIEAAIDLLLELLASTRGSNDALTARLHTVLRALYGRSSEKVSIEQLRLAFAQYEESIPPGAVPPEADVPSPPEPEPEKETSKKKRPKGGHGRHPLPENLPHETKEIKASAEERICSACGHACEADGSKATSYLEFRPASFHIVNDPTNP